MDYNAKQDLYAHIDQLRSDLGIAINAPIDTLKLCERLLDVCVVYHDFDTAGFCGAAFAGDRVQTIVLNSARSYIERNFDCGHELIHLVRHRDRNHGIFNCFNSDQNSFLEWEANEGAAQLIVPYQDFIPRFLNTFSAQPSVHTQEILADHYGVSLQVIHIRLDSLSYEIDQYRRGVPMDEIKLLSRTQRQKRGIRTPRYNAIQLLEKTNSPLTASGN